MCPHALFLQAQSQIMNNIMYLTKFNNNFMFLVFIQLFQGTPCYQQHYVDLDNDVSFHDNVIVMS